MQGVNSLQFYLRITNAKNPYPLPDPYLLPDPKLPPPPPPLPPPPPPPPPPCKAFDCLAAKEQSTRTIIKNATPTITLNLAIFSELSKTQT
ncbi:hypothetical protein CUMW_156950 [Citrus unshiu]|nr:hypothetical protein CUMW_156950 [Citrus unshiu]